MELHWHQLPSGVAPDTTLPPGLHLLLDEGDSAKHRLLPWLAGVQCPPAPGWVQCGTGHGNWRSGTDAYRAQAMAVPLTDCAPEQPVADWLAAQQQRWPDWDAAAWQQHVQGFALTPHLEKAWWQLSTGTQRKFWQAAALASGAVITLIDAPDAGLDRASIVYLGQALNALADQLAEAANPRWILVAHHDTLPGVQWDEVVQLPVDTNF